MKVPLSLLLEYCDPGLPPEEIASVLALTGTEVERVTQLGVEDPSGFVVGRVLSAEPHPDADRLRVCSVDVGESEPAVIVCGAPNVAAGQSVPVALPGAVMPGGMKIKRAKLRGVESNGMICSESELGLGSGHSGILVLPEPSGAAGRPLAEVLPLDEVVLELEITPNRPDCLGVYGVARELHAATGAPLAAPPWEKDLGSAGAVAGIEVDVEVPRLCELFTARVYAGLRPAVTPPKIAAHLTAAGMRPIAPVVDITNYVMLVTGEPMHAFDCDRIAGAQLRVHAADGGEVVSTLDGQDRRIEAGEILISDADGPTSIAGVMGGARSEVSAETTRVLLEAAVWDGPKINSTSSRLGLRSEASGRFEKGLSPVVTGRAQALASALFSEIFSVTPEPGTIEIGSEREPTEIELSPERVASVIGSQLSAERVTQPLERLGFRVNPIADGLLVSVPADRLDVERDVDLIEEIARIDGLDRIEATLPSARTGGGRLTPAQRTRRKLEDLMAGAGCFEIAGWNFSQPSLPDRLRLAPDDVRRSAVVLSNPMSVEESQLRTTLLGSLLDAAATNHARGVTDIRLFETGPVFLAGDGELPAEPLRLGALMSGAAASADWRSGRAPGPVDVHGATAVLATVLNRLHCNWAVSPTDEPDPFLHPGRAGRITLNGVDAGWVGDLHPLVAGEWGLPAAAAFELDIAAVVDAVPAVVHFARLSPHPEVVQDLAVVVDSSMPAADVVAVASGAGGAELESVSVFDVFSGEQLGEDVVSIGLRLVFRSADRTLTEEEASRSRQDIIDALEAEKGASVRG